MAEIVGESGFMEMKKNLENFIIEELEEYSFGKDARKIDEDISNAVVNLLCKKKEKGILDLCSSFDKNVVHEQVLFADLIWILFKILTNEEIGKQEKVQKIKMTENKKSILALKNMKLNLIKKPRMRMCRVSMVKLEHTRKSEKWKACHSNSFNLLAPRKFMKIERIEPLAFQARKRTQNLPLKNKNIWIEEEEWKKLTEYERVIRRFNFSIGHQWVDPIYWTKFSREERNKFKRSRKIWWNRERKKWTSKQISIANYWRRRVKFNGLVFILINGGFFVDTNAKEFINLEKERKKYIMKEYKDFTYCKNQAKEEVKKISIQAYNEFMAVDSLMKKKSKAEEGLSGMETGYSSSILRTNIVKPNLDSLRKWNGDQIMEMLESDSGYSAGNDGDNLNGLDEVRREKKKVDRKQKFEEESEENLENLVCNV